MNYQINEIVIENTKTHQIFFQKTNMFFIQDGSECRIQLYYRDQEAAIFILRFYGNVCEWETDNNDYIIKNIPGFELINNNLCTAEDRTDWITLLN